MKRPSMQKQMTKLSSLQKEILNLLPKSFKGLTKGMREINENKLCGFSLKLQTNNFYKIGPRRGDRIEGKNLILPPPKKLFSR